MDDLPTFLTTDEYVEHVERNESLDAGPSKQEGT